MNRYILLAILGVLLSPRPSVSETPEQRDAITKLEEAASKTNIFELPSFQMKATLQVDNAGKLLDGSYQLLWNGPEQWREEITFPGYTELQIGGKGAVWVQRSPDVVPLRIYQVHELSALAPWPVETRHLFNSVCTQTTKSRNYTLERSIVRS